MDLSIVIPAFNEEDRLPRNLGRISTWLGSRSGTSEIIVVDDGSTDRTVDLIRQQYPHVRIIQHLKNLGKGAAVRTGMLAAQGTWRYLADADLSTPIEDMTRLEAFAGQADVIIGSRRAPGAEITQRQAWWKEGLGRLGNMAIQLLVVRGIRDTQCGFKLFHARTQVLFERQRIQRWGYDFELLYLARLYGFRIQEVAVRWQNDARSKVRPTDYLRTGLELLTIHFNRWRGLYRQP